MTSGSMRCCSTRGPATPTACCPGRAPARRASLSGADRHAIALARRRAALPGRDRTGHDRRRPDDGPGALPAGQRLRRRRRGNLLARSHNFTYRPTDVERFYDMMVLLAKEAMADRQWQTAYDIARQVDDSYSSRHRHQHEKLCHPRQLYDADLDRGHGRAGADEPRRATPSAMFDKYARAGRSLQVAAKGWYWAGRAASQSGDPLRARAYFERAAATPELFYGQLALERLGRIVPAPGRHAVAAGHRRPAPGLQPEAARPSRQTARPARSAAGTDPVHPRLVRRHQD